jgi:hypothetical protein
VAGGGCTPVPERAIESDEFEALLAIIRVPVVLPADAGVKVKFKVVLCPGVRTIPDAPPAFRPAPEMLSFEMVTFAVPVFETETVFEEALPMMTLPKLTLVAFAVSCPTAAGGGGVEFEEVVVVEVEPLDDAVGGGTLATTLVVVEDVVEPEAVDELEELPPKNTPLMTELG